MGRNWVEPSALSALLVAPVGHINLEAQMLALAAGLSARGHRIRAINASDAAHPAEHASSPGELLACACAIYRALSAEPTHIIHTASVRATRAAALASFAYTLRHPCAPEPAIVISLSDEESIAHAGRLLPGDYVIVSSERAYDALLGSGRRQRLNGRASLIVPGSDYSATATLTVYRLAWERRQRENRQALLAFEA